MLAELRKNAGVIGLLLIGGPFGNGAPVDDARAAFEVGQVDRPLWVASGHDDATQRPMVGISRDGVEFERITPFNFTPPAGDGCRDCSLIFWKGRYYMAYTAGNFGFVPFFGIAVSDDLINWSHHTNVPTAPAYTWAPEWCVDGSELYLTYSKPNEVGRWRLFFVKALGEDLTSWTEQELIGGTDIGNSQIDAHVCRYKHTWLLVCRNYSGNGAVIYQSQTSPVSGYSLFSRPDWGATQEGQFLTNMGGGKLRMYFIKTPGNPGAAMSFADSVDGGLTFGEVHPITGNFVGPHMSVFGFTADEVPRLEVERAGGIATVRHATANNLIMETTVDFETWRTETPQLESSSGQWTVVKALSEDSRRFWRLRRPY